MVRLAWQERGLALGLAMWVAAFSACSARHQYVVDVPIDAAGEETIARFEYKVKPGKSYIKPYRKKPRGLRIRTLTAVPPDSIKIIEKWRRGEHRFDAKNIEYIEPRLTRGLRFGYKFGSILTLGGTAVGAPLVATSDCHDCLIPTGFIVGALILVALVPLGVLTLITTGATHATRKDLDPKAWPVLRFQHNPTPATSPAPATDAVLHLPPHPSAATALPTFVNTFGRCRQHSATTQSTSRVCPNP